MNALVTRLDSLLYDHMIHIMMFMQQNIMRCSSVCQTVFGRIKGTDNMILLISAAKTSNYYVENLISFKMKIFLLFLVVNVSIGLFD